MAARAGPSLRASRLESNQEGLRGWVFPGGTIPRVSVAKALDSAPGGSSQHQDGHPPPALRSGGRYPLAARKPGSARSRPASPRPSEEIELMNQR